MKRTIEILAFLALLSSCERNQQPVLSQIFYDTDQITAGSVHEFYINARDPDGDPLTYSWEASDGEFLTPGDQKEVSWKAPADGEGQEVKISVTVSDGEIAAGRETSFELSPPLVGNLSGHVSFRNIKIPLPGVKIRINNKETYTDEDGNFELNELISGKDSLHASKTDYNTNSVSVTIIPDQTIDLDIELLSIVHSSKTYGIVSDQEGNIVEYAQVIILNPDGTESDLKAFTNTSGLFRISYVPHGTRKVIVRKEHNESARYEELRKDIEFTEIEQELNLVITKESLIGEFTDPRDGQVYSFRKIGDYIWMTENLAYLPQVSHPSDQSETEPHYYVYDYYANDVEAAKRKSTFQQYGALYNWVAAKQSCPPEWFLPSNFEFNEIERILGDNAGKKMKSQSGWYESGNGDNSTGFSAFPGGRVENGAAFGGIARSATYHTATSDLQGNINYFELTYDSDALNNAWSSKKNGFSVRCIKID